MLINEYKRTYENFDKCMQCIEDIIIICARQENFEVGRRIERLLDELERKEAKNDKNA